MQQREDFRRYPTHELETDFDPDGSSMIIGLLAAALSGAFIAAIGISLWLAWSSSS